MWSVRKHMCIRTISNKLAGAEQGICLVCYYTKDEV
jgi:hypothetical protein